MWEELDVKKMAEDIGKNYVQPHILVRWLMLYKEVNKISYFIEYLRGNVENDVNQIPLTEFLCDCIYDEIIKTPENLKYLVRFKEIMEILNNLNYKEEEALLKIEKVKTLIFKLFLEEKDNLKKAEINSSNYKNAEELISWFNLLNSQKENLLL